MERERYKWTSPTVHHQGSICSSVNRFIMAAQRRKLLFGKKESKRWPQESVTIIIKGVKRCGCLYLPRSLLMVGCDRALHLSMVCFFHQKKLVAYPQQKRSQTLLVNFNIKYGVLTLLHLSCQSWLVNCLSSQKMRQRHCLLATKGQADQLVPFGPIWTFHLEALTAQLYRRI